MSRTTDGFLPAENVAGRGGRGKDGDFGVEAGRLGLAGEAGRGESGGEACKAFGGAVAAVGKGGRTGGAPLERTAAGSGYRPSMRMMSVEASMSTLPSAW